MPLLCDERLGFETSTGLPHQLWHLMHVFSTVVVIHQCLLLLGNYLRLEPGHLRRVIGRIVLLIGPDLVSRQLASSMPLRPVVILVLVVLSMRDISIGLIGCYDCVQKRWVVMVVQGFILSSWEVGC